jgi:hypothetical protein
VLWGIPARFGGKKPQALLFEGYIWGYLLRLKLYLYAIQVDTMLFESLTDQDPFQSLPVKSKGWEMTLA